MHKILDYYAIPGSMTDPGKQIDLLAGLPAGLAELCQVVQGNLIHVFWAERYGVSLSDADRGTLNLRRLDQKLDRIQERDARPLVNARPPETRQVGNCRDFTLLLVSFLRHQGIPARARCGFGTYFLPGHYEDHWVCEYWNIDHERWVLADAQLDLFQRQVLEIDFDPLDIPRDRFIVAGQAWQLCREGIADPACFGIVDMHGLWFIWGNVVRDLLAQNKVEILPWDWWESLYWSHGLGDPPGTDAEMRRYDELAVLTLTGDADFDLVRQVYETDPGLQVPAGWLV